MTTRITSATELVARLGTPAEIRELAGRGYGPSSPPPTNAHIHLPPNFSAFDSIQQAIDLAAGEQIGVLGISNYYDYSVYGPFVEGARGAGIFPLFGLEIIAMQAVLRDAGTRVNDPANPGKTYLCGKGITQFEEMSPEAARLIAAIRGKDRHRMATMIDRMRTVLQDRGVDVGLDEHAIVEMVVQRHGSPRSSVFLQERHISQAFQQAIFQAVPADERLSRLAAMLGAATKLTNPDDHVGLQNELRSHLMKAGKPAFVDETFVSFAEARRLVLELGGIPSYPVLADGASPVCEFEADVNTLIAELKKRGIHAAEWIPVRNKQALVAEQVRKMRAAGLVVTAGTEHNTLDPVPLRLRCKDGNVPPDILDIFWEGACVVAAHQFLSLHGEVGYVDVAGALNSSYSSADDRIQSLAKIGAAVIQRYFDVCKLN